MCIIWLLFPENFFLNLNSLYFIIFNLLLFYLMCMGILPVCMFVYTTCVPGTRGGQKKVNFGHTAYLQSEITKQ